MDKPNLFQFGDFQLSSGKQSFFKLECDSLVDSDWDCLAEMARKIVPTFSRVIGIPRGGLPLAERLYPYANPCSCSFPHPAHDFCDGKPVSDPRPILLVDDVLTTGESIQKKMMSIWNEYARDYPQPFDLYEVMKEHPIICVVVFARGRCPGWITPICQLHEQLWLKDH